MEDVTLWVVCKQGGEAFKVTLKRGSDVDDLKRKIKGEYFWFPGHHSLIKVSRHDGSLLQSVMKIAEGNTFTEPFRFDMLYELDRCVFGRR
jgi:hypothetical protein